MTQLYVRDLKAKRDRVLDGRRDGAGARSEDEEPDELEELRLYRQMCRRFFGPAADPWNDNEEEEELLARIWEEMNGEVEPPDEAIRSVRRPRTGPRSRRPGLRSTEHKRPVTPDSNNE